MYIFKFHYFDFYTSPLNHWYSRNTREAIFTARFNSKFHSLSKNKEEKQTLYSTQIQKAVK